MCGVNLCQKFVFEITQRNGVASIYNFLRNIQLFCVKYFLDKPSIVFQVPKHLFLYHTSLRTVARRMEFLRDHLALFCDFQEGPLVSILTSIICCREDSQELSSTKFLDTLHDWLMGTDNHQEVVVI